MMKKLAIMLALAVLPLAACKQKPASVESQANMMDADLANQAAALDNEVDTNANTAMASAIHEAEAQANAAAANTSAVANSH